MVLAAFALRLAVMSFVYTERLDPARDHWRFAGEAGRIARSVAQGDGFSSPLFAPTGPTAWLPPVFPYLLAGIFKIFGIYSKTSLLTILSFDCLISALTCIPVFFIGQLSFGNRAGFWSGWAWAFFPYSIFFAADFVWPTTLSTFFMSLLFLLALRLAASSRLKDWAIFGLVYAIAALNDPAVVSVLPILGLWACYRRHRRQAKWFAPAAAAACVFLIMVAPWFVRNYQTFHRVIPFRGGLGLEFYCGNNRDTWHWGPPGYHPSDNEAEWNEYQQLGEVAFMDKKRSQAFDFIASHRRLYVIQSLRRAVYLWTGFWSFSHRYLTEEPMDPPNIVFCTGLTILALLGLRRAFQQDPSLAALYALVFLFFPLVYYLTHPEDYHRRPIDGLFVVLAVFEILSWKRRPTSPSREPSAEAFMVGNAKA